MDRAVTALLCRTSDRRAEGAAGAEALARALDPDARIVGSFDGPRTQRFEQDLGDARGCLLEAGGQVDDALSAGRVPVLTAGDCSVALTTLPVVARHRPDAKVLWLDAHGDFNAPDTTDSGYLGGMALSGACGVWGTGLTDAAVPTERVVLCGVRELEAGERDLLEASRATIIGASLETLVFMRNALDGAPTYVHLDLDVLDPELYPAQFPAANGLTEEKLFDLLDAVADACEVVGVEVTSITGDAELPARVLAPLL